MNPFWKSTTPAQRAVLDAETMRLMGVAFKACVDAPKPDVMLVSRAIISTDFTRRSRSHQRKVDRERRARCAIGIHAWSPQFYICMGCQITMTEHVERGGRRV